MSRIHKSRARRWASQTATVLAGGFFAATLAVPTFAAPTLATIRGHVPDLIKQSTTLGVLPASQPLLVAITLPLRNKAALDELIQGLNNPDSPHYGHYLTSAQFAEQFGPTQAQYDAVVAYAKSKGLTVAQTYPSRTYLNLSGTTAQVNAAFGVTLKQFKSPDGRIFHAPDTEVKVPAGIAASIAAVTGLDDANPPKPLFHIIRRVSEADVKAIMPDATKPLTQTPPEQGTGPFGGFTPSDFRTAYGLNATSLNGAGQTIAIIEYGTTWNIKDTLKYEAQYHLPRAPITIVKVDGGSTTYAKNGPTETNLDIDCQLSMAPAASLRVYLESAAGSTTDALNQVATDAGTIPSLRQLSVSYGFGAETSGGVSSSETAINTAYTTLATAGVSVYVSSGDSGSAADNGTKTSVDISSSAPMVCGVGGTALFVQNPGVDETYKSESTWNANNTVAGGAGGGGVSQNWPLPSYQTNAATFASAATITLPNGNGGTTTYPSNVSTTKRNVPDISCDASPYTGASVYVSGDPGEPGNGWTVIGGTSEAAPLWAGYTALINQNLVAHKQPVLGFPNTVLYGLAYTSAGLTGSYPAIFHDIADGSSNLTVTGGTNYAAVTGYDASTGLGTMQGTNLIVAISGSAPSSGKGSGGGAQ